MNLGAYLAGKSVLVTGSSRGIGRETARLALGSGARVVLNGRDAEALERTRNELASWGEVTCAVGDVSRPDEAARVVATAVAAFGRLDLLVNNAGASMRGPWAELGPGAAEALWRANLLTALWTTQAALPALRESGGRVVFVSSLAGLRGFAAVGLYGALKMGLTALSQSLALEEPRLGVRLVYLDFTENDAGKTILDARGQPFRHDRTWAQTQAQAARTVLRAAAGRRPVVAATFRGRLLRAAQAWLPDLVDTLLQRGLRPPHEVSKRDP